MDFQRLAGGVINFNYCAVEQHAAFSHFKSLWHAGEKAFDDRLDFPAQNAFVRAGKAGVSQVSRAAGENLLVRRLHVRVRAHHGAHLSVEESSERNFFRGRFGVKIHKDDFGLFAQSLHFFSREQKWIFQRRHECPALRVQHGNSEG